MTNDEMKVELESQYTSLLINYFATEFNTTLFNIFVHALVEGSYAYSGFADIFNIDKAEGVMLDFIGINIVGLDRSAPERVVGGETIDYLFDNEYRIIIKHGLFIKNINYTFPAITAALDYIFSSGGAYLKENNGSIMYVFDERLVDRFLVQTIVSKDLLPKPAGISMDVVMMPKRRGAEGILDYFNAPANIKVQLRLVQTRDVEIQYEINDLVTEEQYITGTQQVYKCLQQHIDKPVSDTNYWEVIERTDIPYYTDEATWNTNDIVIPRFPDNSGVQSLITQYPVYYAKVLQDGVVSSDFLPSPMAVFSYTSGVIRWTPNMINPGVSATSFLKYATVYYNGLYYTWQKSIGFNPATPPDQDSVNWFCIGSELPTWEDNKDIKDIIGTPYLSFMSSFFVWKYNDKMYHFNGFGTFPISNTSISELSLFGMDSSRRIPNTDAPDYVQPNAPRGEKFFAFPVGYENGEFIYNIFEDKTGMVYGDYYLIKP